MDNLLVNRKILTKKTQGLIVKPINWFVNAVDKPSLSGGA